MGERPGGRFVSAQTKHKKDRLFMALLDAINQNTRSLRNASLAAANQAVRQIRKDRIAGIEQAISEIYGEGLLTKEQWAQLRRTAAEASDANS